MIAGKITVVIANTRNISAAVVLVFALAPLVTASAAEQRRDYRVEVLVLRHLNNEGQSFEAPAPPPLPSYADADSGQTADENEDGPRRRIRWRGVPWAQLSMKGENSRLRRSRDFRPLLHLGWTQAALELDKSGWVPVRGQAEDGTRIDGSARLAVSRYLHLKLEISAEIPEKGRFDLSQSRRMKSGEIHYFDHPQFGALVRVIPEPEPEPEPEVAASADAGA